MTDESKLFRCACSAEALSVDWLDADEAELCIAIYEHPSKKSCWGWRLKLIWKILTEGSPYGDNVILPRESVKQLQLFLRRGIEKSQRRKNKP
jgi:hypothetical protein